MADAFFKGNTPNMPNLIVISVSVNGPAHLRRWHQNRMHSTYCGSNVKKWPTTDAYTQISVQVSNMISCTLWGLIITEKLHF